MSELAILAFVITPAIVVTLGYIAVRLQEEAGRRHHAAALERGRPFKSTPP